MGVSDGDCLLSKTEHSGEFRLYCINRFCYDKNKSHKGNKTSLKIAFGGKTIIQLLYELRYQFTC